MPGAVRTDTTGNRARVDLPAPAPGRGAGADMTVLRAAVRPGSA
jgi:hypothetical protein